MWAAAAGRHKRPNSVYRRGRGPAAMATLANANWHDGTKEERKNAGSADAGRTTWIYRRKCDRAGDTPPSILPASPSNPSRFTQMERAPNGTTKCEKQLLPHFEPEWKQFAPRAPAGSLHNVLDCRIIGEPDMLLHLCWWVMPAQAKNSCGIAVLLLRYFGWARSRYTCAPSQQMCGEWECVVAVGRRERLK